MNIEKCDFCGKEKPTRFFFRYYELRSLCERCLSAGNFRDWVEYQVYRGIWEKMTFDELLIYSVMSV